MDDLKTRFHTDDIHRFLADAVTNLEAIEDSQGDMVGFAYELWDHPDGHVEDAVLVTENGEIFRISVTRVG